MSDFQITGAEDFLALSKRLKAAGETGLRKELHKALRDAAKVITPATRQAALSQLPSSGGLARRIAKAPQRVQVRTGAATAGVRVGVSGTGKTLDAGTVRHPVFGNRAVFVSQSVRPGWFSATAQKQAPEIHDEVRSALEDMARRVARG